MLRANNGEALSIVLRFTSSEQGELQCRATDTATHESWGIPQPDKLRELIFGARFQRRAGPRKGELS